MTKEVFDKIVAQIEREDVGSYYLAVSSEDVDLSTGRTSPRFLFVTGLSILRRFRDAVKQVQPDEATVELHTSIIKDVDEMLEKMGKIHMALDASAKTEGDAEA